MAQHGVGLDLVAEFISADTMHEYVADYQIGADISDFADGRSGVGAAHYVVTVSEQQLHEVEHLSVIVNHQNCRGRLCRLGVFGQLRVII